MREGSASAPRDLLGFGRKTAAFDLQARRIRVVQLLPAVLARLIADDTAERLAREETIGDVEADVPARGDLRNPVSVADCVLQGQPRARGRRLELPAQHVVAPGVLEQPRR